MARPFEDRPDAIPRKTKSKAGALLCFGTAAVGSSYRSWPPSPLDFASTQPFSAPLRATRRPLRHSTPPTHITKAGRSAAPGGSR